MLLSDYCLDYPMLAKSSLFDKLDYVQKYRGLTSTTFLLSKRQDIDREIDGTDVVNGVGLTPADPMAQVVKQAQAS